MPWPQGRKRGGARDRRGCGTAARAGRSARRAAQDAGRVRVRGRDAGGGARRAGGARVASTRMVEYSRIPCTAGRSRYTAGGDLMACASGRAGTPAVACPAADSGGRDNCRSPSRRIGRRARACSGAAWCVAIPRLEATRACCGEALWKSGFRSGPRPLPGIPAAGVAFGGRFRAGLSLSRCDDRRQTRRVAWSGRSPGPAVAPGVSSSPATDAHRASGRTRAEGGACQGPRARAGTPNREVALACRGGAGPNRGRIRGRIPWIGGREYGTRARSDDSVGGRSGRPGLGLSRGVAGRSTPRCRASGHHPRTRVDRWAVRHAGKSDSLADGRAGNDAAGVRSDEPPPACWFTRLLTRGFGRRPERRGEPVHRRAPTGRGRLLELRSHSIGFGAGHPAPATARNSRRQRQITGSARHPSGSRCRGDDRADPASRG